MINENVLECEDRFGSKVFFGKKNYLKHQKKHVALRRQDSLSKIAETLFNPTFTILSPQKYALCYYLERFSINGVIKYIKVVIDERHRNRKNDPHCTIKTVHYFDSKSGKIKEENYGFKRMY